MPTIKGFMPVSNSDFVRCQDGSFMHVRRGRGFAPMYLSREVAEQNCGEYEQVEAVELTVGENDFFRFQHGMLKSEYTDYRHYRNALRRWKSAKHPYAKILVVEQRTEVTETITFADDKTAVTETAIRFRDRRLSNYLTFPERTGVTV
ncbi:hypothetical protein HTS88_20950 [Pseudarthrobacter oxydans]|uniref:hypothetical protein n=1 Tax=Pseudarthrobacter oxydans TaxID=1671 RepID=UPI0015735C71|nr:hypothetical protein [Pseudarthrobacter oxydans]NSX38850.1 hypothetical protein [Pseudarthrobacter oxydans]